MHQSSTAILHYTAPPVVGGVEAVIRAHARVFIDAGHPVSIVAGRGERRCLPHGCEFHLIPEMHSQHPRIAEINATLERGKVPDDFHNLSDQLRETLEPLLQDVDFLLLHNLFTKHFNLPLTDALYRLLDEDKIWRCIAWCHDFTWTSPTSRSKVHPGYPWDMIRTKRSDTTYVVVSQHRQRMLAEMFSCSLDEIKVIYNGVDPNVLFGISDEIEDLITRLDLLSSDLIILMPVRVTRAKNIEYALRVVASLKSRECQPMLVLTGPPDPHDAKNMEYFRNLKELRSQLNVEREMRFVYESGPQQDRGYVIGPNQVADLMRVSDLIFMPSHREGFGMPIIEAGLLGIPVMATGIPAVIEIGGKNVILVEKSQDPAKTADQILKWSAEHPEHRLKRRVRQQYTWEEIYQRDISSLLRSGEGDK